MKLAPEMVLVAPTNTLKGTMILDLLQIRLVLLVAPTNAVT